MLSRALLNTPGAPQSPRTCSCPAQLSGLCPAHPAVMACAASHSVSLTWNPLGSNGVSCPFAVVRTLSLGSKPGSHRASLMSPISQGSLCSLPDVHCFFHVFGLILVKVGGLIWSLTHHLGQEQKFPPFFLIEGSFWSSSHLCLTRHITYVRGTPVCVSTQVDPARNGRHILCCHIPTF